MREQAKVQNKESINKFTSTSEFGVIIALALLCVAMSFLSPYFLKSSNIINILYQVSQYAILAIGMGFVILTGGIDLSVGYIYCNIGHRKDYARVNPVDYKWNADQRKYALELAGKWKSRTAPGCRYYYGAGDYSRNSLF